MKQKRYMFDVDGVLTNFVLGFTALSREILQRDIPIIDHTEQPDWSFDNIITTKEQSKVWDYIKQSPSFWTNLKPLIGKDVIIAINDLTWDGHMVYFVTSRPGTSSISPQRQTYLWLKNHGISIPSVICSSKKGDVAAALKITHSIEDKIENAWCVHWISPETKSYLVDRPYNQVPDTPKIGTFSIKRVKTVMEFLEEAASEGRR